MTTAVMKERLAEVPPRLKARVAGLFYLVTIVTGLLSLAFASRTVAVNLVMQSCYVAVTLLLYDLFKPVSKGLSLLASSFSLAGCAMGVLRIFHVAPFRINALVFFGFYCLLIGYLIFRSMFLPRILGALMAIAGMAWLTFLSPALARGFAPYNFAVGGISETVLCLWLLLAGVNDKS